MPSPSLIAAFDAAEVETRIDEVGFEYLDLLLNLTGDDYLGPRTITHLPGSA